MSATVLLIGLGDLGGVVLELLARHEPPLRVIAASRDARRGEARANLARLGAMAQGFRPDLRFIPLDLTRRDAVAEAVGRLAPDTVLCTATRQAWWLPDLLPSAARARIERAGFGVWLPVHFTLVHELMRALRDADYGGFAVTAPFPDVVNAVLGRLAMPPTCGIGNLDEIVPKLALLAAARLGVPAEAVHVTLVAHHAVEAFAFGSPDGPVAPFFLRIEHDGSDVTEEAGGAALLVEPYPLPPGRAIHFLTGGSTVRLIGALASTRPTRMHVPGPAGLPGGYPVTVSSAGVRIVEVPGLPLEDMVALNERAHPFDGIERIEADGTVVFTADASEAIRDALGYDCRRVAPDDMAARAGELAARFAEYARAHGVDVADERRRI